MAVIRRWEIYDKSGCLFDHFSDSFKYGINENYYNVLGIKMKIKSKIGSPVSSVPEPQLLKNGALETGHWRPLHLAVILCAIFATAGCQSTGGNAGRIQSYTLNSIEAEWIRNGKPIDFESELWYPVDGVEGFLDSEMRLMGKHQGIEFFIDKVDVRPFSRLYTKFGKNKFRFFEKRMSE